MIAQTLREIADRTANKEIEAYTNWTEAIENPVNGKLEDCLISLDRSENLFKRLGKTYIAALRE